MISIIEIQMYISFVLPTPEKITKNNKAIIIIEIENMDAVIIHSVPVSFMLWCWNNFFITKRKRKNKELAITTTARRYTVLCDIISAIFWLNIRDIILKAQVVDNTIQLVGIIDTTSFLSSESLKNNIAKIKTINEYVKVARPSKYVM